MSRNLLVKSVAMSRFILGNSMNQNFNENIWKNYLLSKNSRFLRHFSDSSGSQAVSSQSTSGCWDFLKNGRDAVKGAFAELKLTRNMGTDQGPLKKDESKPYSPDPCKRSTFGPSCRNRRGYDSNQSKQNPPDAWQELRNPHAPNRGQQSPQKSQRPDRSRPPCIPYPNQSMRSGPPHPYRPPPSKPQHRGRPRHPWMPYPDQENRPEGPHPDQQNPPEEPHPDQQNPPEEPHPDQQNPPDEPHPDQQNPPEEPHPDQQNPPEEPHPDQQNPPEEPHPDQQVPPEEPRPDQQDRPEEPQTNGPSSPNNACTFNIHKEINFCIPLKCTCKIDTRNCGKDS